MANWQRKLDLADVYHSTPPTPIRRLAEIVSERMRKLNPIGDEYLDEMRDEIADDFDLLAEDHCDDAEEFDEIMAKLYDWADTKLDSNWPPKALCWVNT